MERDRQWETVLFGKSRSFIHSVFVMLLSRMLYDVPWSVWSYKTEALSQVFASAGQPLGGGVPGVPPCASVHFSETANSEGKKQETTFRFIKFCAYGQKIPVNSDSSSQTQAKASSKQTNKQKQFKPQNEHWKFIFLWRQRGNGSSPRPVSQKKRERKVRTCPTGPLPV